MFTHQRIILALLAPLAGLPVKAIAQSTQSELRPQVDGYVNLSPAVRLSFRAGYRYITRLGESSSPYLEIDGLSS